MENETTVTTEKAIETVPSFASALKGALGGGKVEKTPEPVTEVAAAPVETKVETPVETKTQETPAAEPHIAAEQEAAPVELETNHKMVPVSALQAEREKRRIAEALLAQQDANNPAQIPEPQFHEEQAQVDPQYKALNDKFLAQSEKAARRAHTDFDPAFQAFTAEIQSNRELARLVVDSEDPGEAAYQVGKNLLVQKKYGTSPGDWAGFASAVEKEAREDERKKVIAEYEGKFTAKAAERSKTPTDISQGRAAGGSTETPWVQPSFSSALRKVFPRN